MSSRQPWRPLVALCAVGLLGGTGHADGGYRRISLTVNAPYLLVPMFELNGEVAVHPRWGIAVRAGAGQREDFGQTYRFGEVGAQGTYYLLGTVDRGVQLGLETRYAAFEGDGMLTGLGDGVGLGPFIGYKRVFDSGVTLGVQLGGELALSGTHEQRVNPYFALGLGVSFDAVGGSGDGAAATVSAAPGAAPDTSRPLDHHHGFMVGASLGLASAVVEGCNDCTLEPGISVDAALGWFLSRRLALMLETTGTVALFSLSSDFGGFGMGLTGPAVQYWPRDRVWVKVGVGFAEMQAFTARRGAGVETGGGGTLAVGYEFHQRGNFAMDVQLRATHGSYHPAGGEFSGADAFTGVVGAHWY